MLPQRGRKEAGLMDIKKAIETLEGWSGVSKLGRVLILVYAALGKGVPQRRILSIVRVLGISGWKLPTSAVEQDILPTNQSLIEGIQRSFVTSQIVQQTDGRFIITPEGKRFVEHGFSDLKDFRSVVDVLTTQLQNMEGWTDDNFQIRQSVVKNPS